MRNGGNAGVVVTWQEAEDALTAAVEYLFALPDRERGFLSAGSRSGWPAIVRDIQADYADAEAAPSPQLTRRNVNLVDRMLIGEKPLANVIPERHRALVGCVLVMQRWPGPDGFGWDLVWRRMGGKLFNQVRGEMLPTTSESMRKAYSRSIQRLAMAMEAVGFANQ
jgi:hypothetical protein